MIWNIYFDFDENSIVKPGAHSPAMEGGGGASYRFDIFLYCNSVYAPSPPPPLPVLAPFVILTAVKKKQTKNVSRMRNIFLEDLFLLLKKNNCYIY